MAPLALGAHSNELTAVGARQFEQAGVKDDDLLVITRKVAAAAAPAPLGGVRPGAVNPSAGFTARPGMRVHDIPVGWLQTVVGCIRDSLGSAAAKCVGRGPS